MSDVAISSGGVEVISNLRPVIDVEVPEDYVPKSLFAFLLDSENKQVPDVSYLVDHNILTMTSNQILPEGDYSFYFRYLDRDGYLKENLKEFTLRRTPIKLTPRNTYDSSNKIIYVKSENEIVFDSNVELSRVLYGLNLNYTNLMLNNDDLKDLNSNSFEIPVEDYKELEMPVYLRLKAFDRFDIFDDVIDYTIIFDDEAPQIDIIYEDNEIYVANFYFDVNVSEPSKCAYALDSEPSLFSSEFKESFSYTLTPEDIGVGSSGTKHLNVLCKDKAGNEALESIDLILKLTEDNKITEIDPDDYMGPDMKIKVRTNRVSSCSYKILDYTDYSTYGSYLREHTYDLSTIEDLSLMDDFVFEVNCKFSVISFGKEDFRREKITFDFKPPKATLDVKNNYEPSIPINLSVQDSSGIKRCKFRIGETDAMEYSCSELPVYYWSKKKFNFTGYFEQPLLSQGNYDVCFYMTDRADNELKICDLFVYNKSLKPVPNPTCEDGKRNQDETDVDCGGSCGPCDLGDVCSIDSDCGYTMTCLESRCKLHHCYNDVYDANLETDIDCGGLCSDKGLYCEESSSCKDDDDCESGFCSPDTNKCVIPTCFDEFKNQDESDIDCGGVCAENFDLPCASGKECYNDDDCETGVCDLAKNTCSIMTKEDVKSRQEEQEQAYQEILWEERQKKIKFALTLGGGLLVLVLSAVGGFIALQKRSSDSNGNQISGTNGNSNNPLNNGGNSLRNSLNNLANPKSNSKTRMTNFGVAASRKLNSDNNSKFNTSQDNSKAQINSKQSEKSPITVRGNLSESLRNFTRRGALKNKLSDKLQKDSEKSSEKSTKDSSYSAEELEKRVEEIEKERKKEEGKDLKGKKNDSEKSKKESSDNSSKKEDAFEELEKSFKEDDVFDKLEDMK